MPLTASARAFGEEEDELLEAGDVDGAVRLNVDTWLGPEASPGTRDRVSTMQRHAFDVQLAAEGSTPEPERGVVDVELAALDIPAVVVEGGHDMDHFRAVARLLATRIPGARHVTLPWAGHLPSVERPGGGCCPAEGSTARCGVRLRRLTGHAHGPALWWAGCGAGSISRRWVLLGPAVVRGIDRGGAGVVAEVVVAVG
ncbi:alpha/beta fold hydrolase [Nocardioides coralli]|uniref:alpha/beta fold hydrolase n=1 Tax=Nocardioides coralli TaxID=2872154 RepID=UPI001CA42E73|nr:alpha/beta hydrolase [Nocardioides coralli]QZY30071.1 alpha/beta hydrolase [Nocardioides coralli]